MTSSFSALAGFFFGMIFGNQVNAAEEVEQARASDPVVLIQAAFFGFDQSHFFHERKVLTHRRYVGTDKLREVAYAHFFRLEHPR